MAASAAFHFDAQASLLKKSATPAGTVTLTLDSVTGVDSILWTVSLTCENSAGDWTISGSTANNATLTVPNVSGIACIIQCRVNGGTRVDPTTGVQSVGDLVKTAKVYTGAEVIVTGETTESDATYGWAPVVNAALTSGGLSEQTVHTADGALLFGRANILTSVADGMTIPAVASYPGQRLLVINAMAATTAVLTRSGADVVVNGTSATAYNLPAGESCWLTAAATGTNVYVEHGGSGGGGGGVTSFTSGTAALVLNTTNELSGTVSAATLPAGATAGDFVVVAMANLSADIVVTRTGADTINGATTRTIYGTANPYAQVEFVYLETNVWGVVGGDGSLPAYVAPAAGDRILFSHAVAGTGTGVADGWSAQDAAAGAYDGGSFLFEVGAAGQSANHPGNYDIDVGAEATDTVSGKVRLLVSGTERLAVYSLGGNARIVSPAILQLVGSSISTSGATNQYQASVYQVFGAPTTYFDGAATQWRTAGGAANIRNWSVALAATDNFDAACTSIDFTQTASATASKTGATRTVRGQNCTGTTSTGGAVQSVGGTGTTKGGACSVVGGAGVTNGNGGDAEIRGGALAGSGKDGNVAIGGSGVNFQSGGRIVHVLNATAEPTAAPTGGGFLWTRAGALVCQDTAGMVSEVAAKWTATSSATSMRELRRAATKTKSTAAAETALTVPAADLPSGDYLGTATVRVTAWSVTESGTVFSALRSVTVKRLSGTTTVVGSSTIGTDQNTIVAGAPVVSFAISSGDVLVQVAQSNTDDLRYSVHIDLVAEEI